MVAAVHNMENPQSRLSRTKSEKFSILGYSQLGFLARPPCGGPVHMVICAHDVDISTWWTDVHHVDDVHMVDISTS
jgi:hypothetical protein